MPPAEDQDRARSLARAREELGAADFDHARAEGRALSLDAAVAYALEETAVRRQAAEPIRAARRGPGGPLDATATGTR